MLEIKRVVSIPWALAALLVAGAPAAGRAEEGLPAPRRIAVVDVNRVFKEYKGTRATEAELEQISKEQEGQREKMVTAIHNLRDELALLNEDSRVKQRQTIEEKLRDLAAFDQQAKELLRDKREQALDSLLKEIERVVTTFAKGKGLDLVLSDRAVLYRVDTLDVTSEIITSLNQEETKAGKGP